MAEMTVVPEPGCAFCRIVARSEPATFLREWNNSIAIRPLDPVTPGHVLVIPRQHVRDFTQRPMITMRTMYAAAQFAAEIGGSFNLITSAGRAATQTVMHLHIHLVPRFEGDGLRLPWSKDDD